MNRKHTWLLVAILLLIFAALKVWAVLNWKNHDENSGQAEVVQCELQHGCTLSDGLKLHTSAPIGLKNSVDIVLETKQPLKQAYISFTMQDMQMGFNRYDLHLENNHYIARHVRLPVCIQNRRDYLMEVYVDGQRYIVPFTTN